MGREIRRVPPNWEHPRWTEGDAPRARLIGELRPCMDQPFEYAAMVWCKTFVEWFNRKVDKVAVTGKVPVDLLDGTEVFPWEDEPTPQRENYRPAFKEEPTWFQVYETVTDGTPVTPAFATTDELVDWLVNKGMMHGTEYEERVSRKAAENFVKLGGVPSMLVLPEHGLLKGVAACEFLEMPEAH